MDSVTVAGVAGIGLRFGRRYSVAGIHPFDAVEWETRDAVIVSETGETVFEQKDVEVPSFWSQQATNVVASKYLRGILGTPERERGARQLIGRVADTLAAWGREGGYFATEQDGEAFHHELCHLLLHQMACFNSPVWFNVGVDPRPQCSACFINSVEDTMHSILDLAKTEGMLFKFGSGTGTNLSPLRGSRESLAGGGTASGPVSFMKGFDAFAGVIKSGGRTRRAAKMVMLDIDHPDIEEFILCKAVEEKKAAALIAAGYDGGFNVPGGAYESVFFQNANHSVRVSEEFMRAVEEDGEWCTRAVTDGRVMGNYRARYLMRRMAESAWECGDPGIQYRTTINDWHTCPNTAPIQASNPCSEYMFLDDTACNLASINLMRFYDPGSQSFDVEGFVHACTVVITAQEIIVDNAGYPREEIAENSRDFRPLGLGYANLGALLMARGLPYDSEAGRDYAAAVTALLSGCAYAQSARIAESKGPFPGYLVNREPMLRVIGKHRQAVKQIDPVHVPLELLQAADQSWHEALEMGEAHGYRNSQISVIAPTGTIAFMMDCDTTGIEPDIALVKFKKLVGGGAMKIVNRTVPLALERLGYTGEASDEIVRFIDETGTIEGAPGLEDEHLPVFDCAFTAARGRRSISYHGHLQMLAAVQPFVSGAISKTVNMPNETTVEEIERAYVESWKLGLKAVAIYRDGCKRSQPLSTESDVPAAAEASAQPLRRRLPDERQAITHKFSVNGHEGYITVGLYDDGQPGEIFVVMAKEGSTISGLMDGFATAISIALQYRVPLETLVSKFCHTRFEPAGFTNNPQIPIAKSVTDYISRWLATKFLSVERQRELGIVLRDADSDEPGPAPGGVSPSVSSGATYRLQQDSPSCQECGAIMVRSGACYHCLNCGSTSGCG